MKKIIIALPIFFLLFSCTEQETTTAQDQKTKEQKNISAVDSSITRSNSYSDLFLDTSAVSNFITQNKISDSIAKRIKSFYNTRNYQFAWFSSDGLTEQARGFWNLHDYVTTYDNDSSLKDKKLQKKMDRLIAEDDLSVSTSKDFINTELTLTQHFITYMLNNYEKGYVKRKEMERFVPRKKEDPIALGDSLVNKKHKDDKYFEDVNDSYKALKDQLGNYLTIAKKGGWPQVTPPDKKALKKGMSSPEISIIKKRLAITGDLAGYDTSQVFNDTLVMAVKNFQGRHGFSETGMISDSLIKEMNVPVEKRIEQILMNMDRMRWLANNPSGNLIVVNIPEFVMHVYNGKQKDFDIDVVVGKEGHNTMMFNGDLNQVVFSPYWNVPPSIVTKEILPAMDKNPNYLSKEDMEITGNEDGIPVIRQRPGGKNALGKVKFLFPNSFNIYFHDTPSKSLFEKEKRAYSHGCIRVKEPEKLANYVLRNQPEWTPEKINEAMNSGEEKYVKVKDPIPVVITYYTAWVDENGRLNFREDIYGHDASLAQKMFSGSAVYASK
jgi:murein L,D-transpeptidase YcbB/YkuD